MSWFEIILKYFLYDSCNIVPLFLKSALEIILGLQEYRIQINGLKPKTEANAGKLEQFLSPEWDFLLLFLKAVFGPDDLLLISCIHILIFLVSFYL